MTHLTARLAPPNSLLLVLDARTGELPLPNTLGGAPIASTSSALAIGTLMELDGETEVHLTDTPEILEQVDLAKRWEGRIATDGVLGVLTVHNEVLIELNVGKSVRVQVWTNDPTEPDVIWVLATP
jgi:hypothetical protein